MAEDTEWIVPGNSSVSGTYRGKAEVTQFSMTLVGTSFRTRFIADGDHVVVLTVSSPVGDAGTGAKALAPLARMWHTMSMDATVVLGQQGRLVIPAEVRSALGLAPGDRFHLHVAGQRLVLARQQDAVAELRGLASALPQDRSLVDELLAERRLAAAAE
jgi:antitoxin PrlF